MCCSVLLKCLICTCFFVATPSDSSTHTHTHTHTQVNRDEKKKEAGTLPPLTTHSLAQSKELVERKGKRGGREGGREREGVRIYKREKMMLAGSISDK